MHSQDLRYEAVTDVPSWCNWMNAPCCALTTRIVTAPQPPSYEPLSPVGQAEASAPFGADPPSPPPLPPLPPLELKHPQRLSDLDAAPTVGLRQIAELDRMPQPSTRPQQVLVLATVVHLHLALNLHNKPFTHR